MNINQYKFTGDDESYTYDAIIEPIISFVEEFRKRINIEHKSELKIWCPFDLKEDIIFNNIQMFKSNYVKLFEQEGYKVIATHIATGQDFFEYEPEDYDIIISNPPFKNKAAFFKRILEFNKPFALLTPVGWLNSTKIYELFQDRKMQLLIPDKRAKFFNENGCIGGQPSFKSIYCCIDFLVDKDIAWIKLDRKKENC